MLQDWLARYGVAELCGIALALVGSYAMRRLTHHAIAAAYGGAWGETIGYAGAIAWRDVGKEVRTAARAQKTLSLRNATRLIGQWIAEFGPAGVLDTLAIRPLAMGLGMRFFGPLRGLVAGKLAADVVFYIPVIFMYERRRRSEQARD